MKKIVAVLGTLCLLAACIRAGSYDIVSYNKTLSNLTRGYSAHELAAETSKGVSAIRENEVVLNKAITAKKGESVLSDKIYDKSTFEKVVFMANKAGSLQDAVHQLNIKPRQAYEAKRYIKMDGKVYYILESGINDYVYMFDDDGNFYNYGGLEDDGVIRILDEELVVYPADLKMQKTVQTRDEISNVRRGYEVKYAGNDLGRIWFDYLAYDGSDASGKFERISFPDKPGLITINGKGLRVLKANDGSITFMVLKDES